jgi:hypothetical protein
MESFMRCLYMTVHKASKIALALRSRSDVFNSVVQEKASGHGMRHIHYSAYYACRLETPDIFTLQVRTSGLLRTLRPSLM